MIQWIRDRCAVELDRAERLIRAWPTMQVFYPNAKKDKNGKLIPLKQDPAGPVGEQVDHFVRRVVLNQPLKFSHKVDLDDMIPIKIVPPYDQRN